MVGDLVYANSVVGADVFHDRGIASGLSERPILDESSTSVDYPNLFWPGTWLP